MVEIPVKNILPDMNTVSFNLFKILMRRKILLIL
jgi:hypothetical protein